MKRALTSVLVILVIYAVFIDLTKGTLLLTEIDADVEDTKETMTTYKYFEVTVKPGDTLLSLIESQGFFPEHVPIEQIVEDFIYLNNGITPEQMQPGQIYRIPYYDEVAE